MYTLFYAATQQANERYLRLLAIMGLLITPGPALLGALVYNGRTAWHQLGWHTLMIITDLIGLRVMTALRHRPRIPTVVVLAGNAIGSGAATAMGFAFGGPMALLVVAGFFLIISLTIPLVLSPPERFATVLMMGAFILLGFLLEFPSRLDRPMLLSASGLLVVSLAFSFTIGWSATALAERTYCEQRRLTAAADSTAAELRKLATRIDELREEDRTHIARELHDELGTTLTAIRLVASLPPDEARARKIEHLLDDAHAAVRRIATELRPSLLDELGLAATVEWLLARHEQLTGVVCLSTIEFRDDAEEGLDPVRATAVFRCLQESLTNVVRHARASTMAVHLQRQGDELLLRVRDDGVGFCLDRGTPPGHYGLIGMRERALAVGGRLEVQTEPGSGTEIRLHIPLSPPLRERMEVAA